MNKNNESYNVDMKKLEDIQLIVSKLSDELEKLHYYGKYSEEDIYKIYNKTVDIKNKVSKLFSF